jgi:hypothetical protein
VALINAPGIYAQSAASFLMKWLYGARQCCPWLVVSIQRLACYVTKWNADCDRRVKRLYDFVYSNLDLVLTGELSSSDHEHLTLHAWPDADLNGDFMHTKSTSGCFIEVQGERERSMPSIYGSRKQGGTALHTPESETVSLATFLRNDMLPLQYLWQRLLRRPVNLIVHEDNTGCIRIVQKGYSPSLRCLVRTHRLSLGVVHEASHEAPP